MNLTSFSQQLVRDLKASAAKTVTLGVLLLVGFYFWVPPLLKAFSSSASSVPTKPVDGKSTTNGSTASATASAPNATASAKKPRDSKTLLKQRQEQPLLQPASADELPQKPFGLNDDLLPLPVLIAEDSLAEPPAAGSKAGQKLLEKLDGLALKSTLVGPSRRVAIINNQLFREGQTVSWNDRQLVLEVVNRKSVTLTDGSQRWHLTLKDSQSESDE